MGRMSSPAGRRFLVVVAGFLGLVAGAQEARAHPGAGDGDPTFPGILEGEMYDTPDEACDPAPNGKHTVRVTEVEPWASGDETARLPYTGCGVTFDEVLVGGVCRFVSYSVAFTGPVGSWTAIVLVFSDGIQVNKGVLVVDNSKRGTFQFLEHFTTNLAPGEHTIRGEYRSPTAGFEDTAMRLDKLETSPACGLWNR